MALAVVGLTEVEAHWSSTWGDDGSGTLAHVGGEEAPCPDRSGLVGYHYANSR